MKKIFCILMLLTSNSYASSLYGFFGKTDEYKKIAGITFSYQPIEFLGVDGTFGIYPVVNVLAHAPGYLFEVAPSFTVRADLGLFGTISQGVSYDTKIMKDLTSKWQYPTKVSAGIWHKHGLIGIFWKHYSNGSAIHAGLQFIGAEFGYVF